MANTKLSMTLDYSPVRRLLVANRGEIATRILATARELDIETFALYTAGDASHTTFADHAIELKSPSSYMDINEIVSLVKQHGIDAVHPGYGFLSESEEFSARIREAGSYVIGPGPEILGRTGDKLKARRLAEECRVPTCPALSSPTDEASRVLQFAREVGFPIMVKAVDGGGGRGIRLIRREEDLESAVKRATEESPSRKLFAEKAAVDGFRHVEIQIIGDGKGDVRHLWERECSIQRRFQKIVEIAPSTIVDRKLIARVIGDAVRMAQSINYLSLGTFEFLVNPDTKEYYFLEINPRLQVEHTITESISLTDLVHIQLLIARGAALSEVGLGEELFPLEIPPSLHSIQLRITAENVDSDWSLSIGKIQSFQFPSGNGIRVDTHLVNGHASIVGADFDSLVAKLIISSSTWETTVQKAKRALEDTHISGIKTNIDILKGIVSHPDFLAGSCTTQWLEANQQVLLQSGRALSSKRPGNVLAAHSSASSNIAANTGSGVILRRGDAWSLDLKPSSTSMNNESSSTSFLSPAHLQITRILRNEFPSSLSADLTFTPPSTATHPHPVPASYTLTLNSTTASSSALTSQHRRGNPLDPSHVMLPFPGKLVEVLVDEGDEIKEGDVVCVVQQMKMELEVRAKRGGVVGWVFEGDVGEDVAEGTLVCVVDGRKDERVGAKL